MPTPHIRIGVSGWRYAPWRGTFYPPRLPQREELAFASRKLSVIEVNGTFYSLQRPESYQSWYLQTPENFVFALKGPRYITHMRRLTEIEQPIANWFASGLFNLRHKLGPIVWQFPANFKYDHGRLRDFLAQLPQDTAAAARIARACAPFMRGRSRLTTDARRPLRYAIEVRHASFGAPAFLDLLRDFNVALVVSESPRTWPMFQELTADFMYLRLHGDKHLYRSGYGKHALARWAARIRTWHASHRDVFCLFDNTDDKLRAPFDAQALAAQLDSAVDGAPANGPRLTDAPATPPPRSARHRMRP